MAPELKLKANAVVPVIERYAAAGQEIAQLASQDAKTAMAKLPAFLALFKQLEAEQDMVIEGIEAVAKAPRMTRNTHAPKPNGGWPWSPSPTPSCCVPPPCW